MRALLLIAIAGCYNPNAFAPCQTVCAADEGCTPGFVCGTNGYCRPANIGDCSPTQDSSIQIDADLTDAPPGSICFGTGLIKNFCFVPTQIPTMDLVLPATFDTTVDANCSRLLTQNNGPEICVMVGRTYKLPAADAVRVIGTRPLAIVTTQGINIAGTLSVASLPGEPGAGTASGLLCSAVGIGQPGAGPTTGGGGGGGALTTAGGDGGEGAGGIAGGMGGLTRLVTRVRGGCDGARGGNHDTSNGGQPGAGGGAIYLLTDGVMTVSGNINASGAGGRAPAPQGGGGGGGSGGFIGLDARTFDIVMASARIFSSGGSGASGGGATSDGAAGGIATRDADPGRTGSNDGGGPGGEGSSVNKGGTGGSAELNGGGGGGGGGAGYVGVAGPFPGNVSTSVVRPSAKPMN